MRYGFSTRHGRPATISSDFSRSSVSSYFSTGLGSSRRLGPLDVLAMAGAGLAYDDLAPRAERFELEGMEVLVLGLPALIETKEQAGRDKDRLALPVLRETLRLREPGRG